MKNKLLFAVCLIALFLLSAISVLAVANVQISFADGTYHKDLPYNHVEDLSYTVTGVYYPVYYNIWTYDQINGGLVETLIDTSTSFPLFNEIIGLDTSTYMPGSYEVIIEGYDGDGQVVTNPIQTTFTVENLPTISVYPSNVIISPTQTQQFGAYGGSAGNDVTDYIWSVTGPCSITQQAIVTGNNLGSCTVTAKDKGSPATGSQDLTVIASSIYIDPAIDNAYPNEHKEFTVMNGIGPFTWTVSSNCNYDVVDSDTVEVYGANVDECNIQVFDTVGLGQASATLNIITTDLSITPAYDTAYPTQQKSYVASGAAGNYIWSVSPESFCDIEANGDTALVNGTNENIDCIITVTDSLGSGEAEATLDVITSDVNIIPQYQVAYPNVVKTYTATGIIGEAIWSVSPESVCDINFVGNNAYVSGSDVNVDCSINVVDTFGAGTDTATLDIIANDNLQIYPTPQQAYVGEQKQYTAVNAIGNLTWTVTPEAFCDLSSSGITALVNGSNPDFDCNITLTDEAAGYATGLLEVIDSPNITVVPPHSDLFLNPGYDTQQFNAYGGVAGNDPEDYTWEVSDTSNGFFNYIMVFLGLNNNNCMIGESTGFLTALQIGDCYVKATDTQSPGFGTATVTVHPMPTVEITPNPSTILVNENELLTATGGFSGVYSWEIINGASHCEFVTINNDNTLIKGTSEGNCTIKAIDTASGAYATASVNVEEDVFDPLNIIPEEATIYVGDTQEFVAYDGEPGYSYEWDIISGQSHCSFLPLNSMDTNIVEGNSVGNCTIQVTRGSESVTSLLHVIQSPSNLYINPESATIFEGDEQTFTAYQGQSGNYTWNIIAGQSYCSITSVSNDVLVVEGTAAGSCLIQVEDSGETDTALLTVVETPTGLYVLPPSSEVNVGEVQLFSAYDGNTGIYNWTIISGQTHCEITGNYNNQILVTGTTVGSCQIQAEDSGETATAVLTVNEPANNATLEIIPDYAEVTVGNDQLFTAVNGDTGTYYWSFLNGASHCSIVSISNDEIVIEGTSVGSCTLQAEDSGETATAVLNVTNNATLEIIPDYAEVTVGNDQLFTAVNGDTGTYYWSFLNGSSHCSIVSISNDEIVIEGTSVGSCTLQVEDSGETATAVLNVTNNASLEIIPEEATKYVGQSQLFSAVNGETGIYSWTLLSGSCTLDVLYNNIVQVTGNALGDCLIQVEDSGETAIGTLHVNETIIPNIIVMPPEVNLTVGQTQQFTAFGGCGYDWSVTGPCTINQSGFLITNAQGQCNVIADDQCSTGLGTANVTIEDLIIPVINVIPESVTLDIGQQQQYSATGGCDYIWSVTGPCSINQDGLLSSYSTGSCTITATDVCSGEFDTADAIIVNGSGYPISAEIIASPLSGEAPLYVGFEGVGTGFGQLTYEWNFGYPNYLAYGKYSYHTFHDIGTYPVYLTVTDALGRTATDVEHINVLSHEDMKDQPQSRIIVKSLVNTNEGNVFCGKMAEFYIKLTNTGKELDDFKIAATVPEAGLYQSLPRFDFKNTVSRFLSINIPCDVDPGLYTVHFTFSNDKLRRTVYRDFIVEG